MIGQGEDILREFVSEFLIKRSCAYFSMQSKTTFCTLRVEFHPRAILQCF